MATSPEEKQRARDKMRTQLVSEAEKYGEQAQPAIDRLKEQSVNSAFEALGIDPKGMQTKRITPTIVPLPSLTDVINQYSPGLIGEDPPPLTGARRVFKQISNFFTAIDPQLTAEAEAKRKQDRAEERDEFNRVMDIYAADIRSTQMQNESERERARIHNATVDDTLKWIRKIMDKAKDEGFKKFTGGIEIAKDMLDESGPKQTKPTVVGKVHATTSKFITTEWPNEITREGTIDDLPMSQGEKTAAMMGGADKLMKAARDMRVPLTDEELTAKFASPEWKARMMALGLDPQQMYRLIQANGWTEDTYSEYVERLDVGRLYREAGEAVPERITIQEVREAIDANVTQAKIESGDDEDEDTVVSPGDRVAFLPGPTSSIVTSIEFDEALQKLVDQNPDDVANAYAIVILNGMMEGNVKNAIAFVSSPAIQDRLIRDNIAPLDVLLHFKKAEPVLKELE